MKRSRLGPGRKSLDRGSTFKRPGETLDAKALLRNNPRRREGEWPGERGWTQRVFSLYGRACVVCRGAAAAQAHHAVPKRTIIARGGAIDLLVFDARNGVPVCHRCHEAHENGSRRIPYVCLPGGVVAWAHENGWAWYLDRIYPKALERLPKPLTRAHTTRRED